MTILVDAAVWPWRGQRWAHLISDCSLEELHTFTNDLGIRRLAFGGDHYDITAAERAAALGVGATATDAREIVAALHRSGLRCKPPHSAWRWTRVGHVRSANPADLDRLRSGVQPLAKGNKEVEDAQWETARSLCLKAFGSRVGVEVVVLDRTDERALVVSGSTAALVAAGGMTDSALPLSHRTTHRGRTTTHELVAHGLTPERSELSAG